MVSNHFTSPSTKQGVGVTAMACENSIPLVPSQSADQAAGARAGAAGSASPINGAAMSSISANGSSMNGISANSSSMNGISANASPMNGISANASSMNGSAVNNSAAGEGSGNAAVINRSSITRTSDENYGLTTPVAPEGGLPVWPGNTSDNSTDSGYGLTTPIAPDNTPPIWPGNSSGSGNTGSGSGNGGNGSGGNGNSGSGNTIWPVFPWFPACPGCGGCISCGNNGSGSGTTGGGSSSSPTQFGQVRFLNASTANTNVSVTFDNTIYASNTAFGTITNYRPVSDGFHTVSVRRTTGLQALVVQQSFPFAANQKYTLVLVDSAAGGVNLIQVDDIGCSNLSYNTGCYRVANMAYSGSSFDVFLYSHDAVFRNVGFQEVTSYKQAIAGSYQFYITNSTNYPLIKQLPILIIGAGSGIASGDPLVSYSADIAAGKNYTSYLIGSSWSDLNFRVLTVQD